MPNWCSNSLKVNHPEKEKAEALLQAIKSEKFCEFFLPEPTGEGHDWYTWRLSHWGTKWEPTEFYFPISDENGDVELSENEGGRWETVVRFESAWSPPLEVYRAATQAGYTVEAYWIEEGCAYTGLYRPEYEADPDDEEDGGETEADYELASRDSEEEWNAFLKSIPKALVEAFGLDGWSTGDWGSWGVDTEGDAEEEEIKAAQVTQ